MPLGLSSYFAKKRAAKADKKASEERRLLKTKRMAEASRNAKAVNEKNKNPSSSVIAEMERANKSGPGREDTVSSDHSFHQKTRNEIYNLPTGPGKSYKKSSKEGGGRRRKTRKNKKSRRKSKKSRKSKRQ